MTRPETERHALELAATIEGRPGAMIDPGGADPLLDDDARTAYAARLRTIKDELDEADRRGDAAASTALATEEAAIEAELAAATGLGGRTRRATTDADRARVNVTKHLKRAIARIGDVDPELGNHLAECVDTGMCARYRSAGTRIRWNSDGTGHVTPS
ncbi:MAG: hypothetical protein DHS20C19_14010 [Acidimicrobiales bacterium]|nr:MAG: hypothetical protein DHS20C19_14010 [Acidimicrobiales bacterium]